MVSSVVYTKWTLWIKLSSLKSSLEWLKWDLLRVSETSISQPGEYWSLKSYFWRHKKNSGYKEGKKLLIYILKIDFSCLLSLITLNLQLYNYSWKHSTPKTIERVSFSIWCVMLLVVPYSLQWIANSVPFFIIYGSIILFKKGA